MKPQDKQVPSLDLGSQPFISALVEAPPPRGNRVIAVGLSTLGVRRSHCPPGTWVASVSFHPPSPQSPTSGSQETGIRLGQETGGGRLAAIRALQAEARASNCRKYIFLANIFSDKVVSMQQG